MIANLIGGFVAILIGVSLIGPISDEVGKDSENGCGSGSYLNNYSSWGATVCKLVPGFFALGLLGIGVALTYASLRQAGVV
jgi:hypothetical protein